MVEISLSGSGEGPEGEIPRSYSTRPDLKPRGLGREYGDRHRSPHDLIASAQIRKRDYKKPPATPHLGTPPRTATDSRPRAPPV